MREYNQTAEAEILDPMPLGKHKRERVVYGTNEPVSPEFLKQAILGWLMFLGGIGILLFLMALGLEWKMGFVFTTYLLSSVGVSLLMWKWVLPYMTGDNVAEKEIAKERQVDLAHIAADRDVRIAHLEVEDKKIEYWREVELARINATTDNQALLHRIAAIEENQTRLLTSRSQDPVVAKPVSYVPPTVDHAEMRAAVSEWVLKHYDEDGQPVNLATVKMPWNGEWVGKTWRDDAARLLKEQVLQKHGTVFQFSDDYRDRAAAVSALSQL